MILNPRNNAQDREAERNNVMDLERRARIFKSRFRAKSQSFRAA